MIHTQTTTDPNRPLLELTDKLGEYLPPGLDSLFFVNSGTEAVEAAVGLAKMATNRSNIVAFHGRTVRRNRAIRPGPGGRPGQDR
ncbi:aminotransferase class III-fold pyridoxal phosphate-dependent enzyme [Skermania piniformis]|uniref:aminotransferase class III-fold pyridoxal phosphate-dependent enzyme n=1 Tax=Skermania pinensis TaxID=39122 RepID=UPI0008349CE3